MRGERDHIKLAVFTGRTYPKKRGAAMVFPFTHIGGIGWLFTMLITGCTCIFVEAFVPATTIPVLQR